MRSGNKQAVKRFWEQESCGERYGSEQDRVRYELEPEILEFANFDGATGKRVLEIGVGMGADFLRWARAGAVATGVDLTERAVTLTRQRLQEEDLKGFALVADAESLPFADGQFDLVYSWGVLHHTPRPAIALHEAQRVLAPSGELKVMLYHRYSWVALAAWARFCLFRGTPMAGLRTAVANIESPGTQAFTPDEVSALLPCVRHHSIATRLSHWDRKCAPFVSRTFGNRFGWFLLIEGSKPAK
jgi:ubiquinone/menaquinone biosynthesis C-methylase UbiE